MREVVKIVSGIREAIERIDISSLRRSDAQIVGIFKEVVSGVAEISEKIACIDEARRIEKIDFLCNRKLVLVKTPEIIALSKLGFGRGLSFSIRGNELKIYNRGYEISLSPHQIIVKLENISKTIDLRKIEGVSEHSSLISRVFSNVIETINKTNEDLTKCIKLGRIKC